jgi:hypothetical protein
VRDKEHELQFKAHVLMDTPPTTSEGVERHLGGGLLKGVVAFNQTLELDLERLESGNCNTDRSAE